MSDDFKKGLLMKGTKVPDGWIDLSVGDPMAVNNALCSAIGDSNIMEGISAEDFGKYPPSRGLPELVKFLEDRHGSPVIITPGAKYALYALMNIARDTLSEGLLVNHPYWISMPRLGRDAGLKWRTEGTQTEGDIEILVSPNNPTGRLVPTDVMDHFTSHHHNPISMKVHDAAYHSPAYLPDSIHWLAKYGDAQIFSSGKMWGLAGLRVGYIVCHEESLISPLEREIEKFCAGVSTASQKIVLNVEKIMSDKKIFDKFVSACRSHFSEARGKLSSIPSSFLQTDDVPNQSGMFAWCKKGPEFDPAKVRAIMIDGENFGDSQYVRINLSVKMEQIDEFVKRCHEA